MKKFNIFYYTIIGVMTAVFMLSLILLLMWYDKDIYSIAGQEYVRETRHYRNVTRYDYFPIERPEDILSSFLFKGNVQHLSKMFELDLMQSDTAIENFVVELHKRNKKLNIKYPQDQQIYIRLYF